MSWTSRWGIIGTIALAHVGIAVGYQAFLNSPAAEVYAQTTTTKDTEPPTGSSHQMAPPTAEPPVPAEKQPATTPPASMPIPSPGLLPEVMKNALPLPGNPTLPVASKQLAPPIQGILPVAAQEPDKPPLPLPPVSAPTPPPPAPSTNLVPPPVAQPAQAPLPTKTETKLVANCPWNLSVEIVNGRTHLTAQNGKDVKFTVSCEKLDMETPGGAIHACGKVKLATDSIEGSCDKLTISWQEDVVILDKVQLKCKLEGHDADLHAEQLRVRLSRVAGAAVKEQTYSSWSIFP